MFLFKFYISMFLNQNIPSSNFPPKLLVPCFLYKQPLLFLFVWIEGFGWKIWVLKLQNQKWKMVRVWGKHTWKRKKGKRGKFSFFFFLEWKKVVEMCRNFTCLSYKKNIMSENDLFAPFSTLFLKPKIFYKKCRKSFKRHISFSIVRWNNIFQSWKVLCTITILSFTKKKFQS